MSPVKPACVAPEMPSRVAPVMVRPLTVLPSASVTASLAAVVFVICGFVPAATSVLRVDDECHAFADELLVVLAASMPAFWPLVVPSPL